MQWRSPQVRRQRRLVATSLLGVSTRPATLGLPWARCEVSALADRRWRAERNLLRRWIVSISAEFPPRKCGPSGEQNRHRLSCAEVGGRSTSYTSLRSCRSAPRDASITAANKRGREATRGVAPPHTTGLQMRSAASPRRAHAAPTQSRPKPGDKIGQPHTAGGAVQGRRLRPSCGAVGGGREGVTRERSSGSTAPAHGLGSAISRTRRPDATRETAHPVGGR